MKPQHATLSAKNIRNDKRYGCLLCPSKTFDRLKITSSKASRVSVQFHVNGHHPEIHDWQALLTSKPSVSRIKKPPSTEETSSEDEEIIEEIPETDWENDDEEPSVFSRSTLSQGTVQKSECSNVVDEMVVPNADQYDCYPNTGSMDIDQHRRVSYRRSSTLVDSLHEKHQTVLQQRQNNVYAKTSAHADNRPRITGFDRAASVGIYGLEFAKLAKLAFPSLDTGRAVDDEKYGKWIYIAHYMYKKSEYLEREYEVLERDRDQLLADSLETHNRY